MIDCPAFANALTENGIRFFTGVPDSLLKEICGYLADRFVDEHVIAANEGNAVALAAGHHLATGETALVYLQNSGLGNTINPLTSLMSEEVYQIPLLLLIGWRGEPGIADEPQHRTQGRITKETLELLEIPYLQLTSETDAGPAFDASLATLLGEAREASRPVALLVSKGTFRGYDYGRAESASTLERETAVTALADAISTPTSLVVSTTGKLSRELYEYRRASSSTIVDFYNVGSMGHLSQIALGLARALPERRVYCFDGDGAALMHMGGLAVAAAQRLSNYHYVMFNNGAHDSVGGQPTVAPSLDFRKIAEGLGFERFLTASTPAELEDVAKSLSELRGPTFSEIRVRPGSRSDLGRPVESPAENKHAFMIRTGAIR